MALPRDWRDPLWSSKQAVQTGLDHRTTRQRLTLFGLNVIDIEGKSTLTLLIEEVRATAGSMFFVCNFFPGHTSVLCVSNRQYHPMVPR